MKTFIGTLFILMMTFSLSAQDTDSLVLEEVKSIRYMMRELNNRLDQLNKLEKQEFLEIKNRQDSNITETRENRRYLEKSVEGLQSSQQQKTEQILAKLDAENSHLAKQNIILYILLTIAILLILILFVFLRNTKKDKIEYLIREAERHSIQNVELLDQAEELEAVKKNLKKILKQQKKIQKRKKK
jgi:predicted PurR-regulated permease PerM